MAIPLPNIPSPFNFNLLKPLNTPEGLQAGSNSFTSKDAHVVETVKIFSDDPPTLDDAIDPATWYSCCCYVLGFSYVDSRGILQRIRPLQHWTITNLFATQISNAVGELFDGTIVSLSTNGLLKASQFISIRFNIEFTVLPFSPLTGSQLAGNPEYYRYTSYKSETHLEFLERKQGQMVLVETGAGPPVGPPLYSAGPPVVEGFAIPGAYKVPVQKTTVTFTWWGVPEQFLADTTTFAIIYPKLAEKIATLNDATFLNQVKGTLLMMPYKPTRYPSILQVPDASVYQYFLVDVEFQFIYFQPYLGAASPIQSGWNNLPYFEANAAEFDGAPAPIWWYYATLSDPTMATNTTATALFQLSSFADMFTYWDS